MFDKSRYDIYFEWRSWRLWIDNFCDCCTQISVGPIRIVFHTTPLD